MEGYETRKDRIHDEVRLQSYRVYETLPREVLETEFEWLYRNWENFVRINDNQLFSKKSFSSDGYFVNKRNLYEVIRRVDERIVYYHIFHQLDGPSEYKIVALYCHWLITLKPFFVVDESSPLYGSPNETFALHLILSVIYQAYETAREDEDFIYRDIPFQQPSEKRIVEILYNFKYTNMSREAMVSFVETFADNWGVGISYIHNLEKKKQAKLQKQE